MQITSDIWQLRAAMCELLSLSFRYPKDRALAQALSSGEWFEAVDEITAKLNLLTDTQLMKKAFDESKDIAVEELIHMLRREATPLFVGLPEAIVYPYEGAWLAVKAGKAPVLFVSKEALEAEAFCKSCGLKHNDEANDPIEAIWTELELMTYLALRAAEESNGLGSEEHIAPAANLPGGSAAAAWAAFVEDHAKPWMPGFAKDVIERSNIAFFPASASLLKTFIDSL